MIMILVGPFKWAAFLRFPDCFDPCLGVYHRERGVGK